MRLRAFPHALAALLAVASPAGLGLLHGEKAADASVSIAVTWEALLRESSAAAVVTPTTEARSVWESGRIYTYSRVRIDRAVAGELATGDEAWVRTMGGIVGKVGQIVEGEAVLAPGRSSLLFLARGESGTFDVTARGQGQFPLVAQNDSSLPLRVVRSNTVGALLQPRLVGPVVMPKLAADMLHGRSIDDAARDIVAAWSRAHAP
jgi:hypothetical protein